MRLDTSKESAATIALSLTLIIPLMFFSNFVVVQVWRWHVTPWLGFAAPPYWSAFAVLWVMSVLRASPADNATVFESSTPIWHRALARWFAWAFALLIGWVTI